MKTSPKIDTPETTNSDTIVKTGQLSNASINTLTKKLFVKYKQMVRVRKGILQHKSPVLFLERRSGEVEFYEDATSGVFEFKHSDGETRFIILTPSKQKKFNYGDSKFTGYFCHEDHPLPLPDDPLMTTEQLNIAIEKSLNDMKKYKAKELKEWSGMIWKIGLGVALIIVAYALYTMLAPPPVNQVTQVIQPVVQHNLTDIAVLG